MKIIAKSRNGKMLKIGTDEKSAKWYFLSEKVVRFVAKAIKRGDEVTIKYDKNGGKYVINFIEKGKGESVGTQETEPEFKCEDCGTPLKDGKYKKCYTCNKKAKESGNTGTSNDGKKYCSCGTEIKNHAYDTCYSCSQKAKENSSTISNSSKPTCNKCGKELKDDKYDFCYTCFQEEQNNPSPATTSKQESIKRQAIMHATSRALISLQGHVNPNNIEEIATRLYKKFQELVG